MSSSDTVLQQLFSVPPRRPLKRYRCLWDEPSADHLHGLRRMIAAWISHYPPPAVAELCGRFRSNDVEFRSAFFEIYMHELLTKMGFQLEIHPRPPGPGRHRPDFLAVQDGNRAFYFEASVLEPSDFNHVVAECAFGLRSALEAVSPSGFDFEAEIRAFPERTPDLTPITREAKGWVRRLRVADVHRARRNLTADPGSADCAHEGLKFRLVALPRIVPGDGSKHRVNVEVPALLGLDDVRIRRKLDEKLQDRSFDLPYVVAINGLGADHEDMMDGTFGKLQHHLHQGQDGRRSWTYSRAGDGAVSSSAEPRGRALSAIVFVRDLDCFTVNETHPVLVHNPLADIALPAHLWKLEQHPREGNTPVRAEALLRDSRLMSPNASQPARKHNG